MHYYHDRRHRCKLCFFVFSQFTRLFRLGPDQVHQRLLVRCCTVRMFSTQCSDTRLGDRKGIWPIKDWVLICWRRRFDRSLARLVAPVITTSYLSCKPRSIWKMAVKMERVHCKTVSNQLKVYQLASDFWFDSRSRRFRTATLGKSFTCDPLSLSSIIWYRPKDGDALRLGRLLWAWRKVMAAYRLVYGSGHLRADCLQDRGSAVDPDRLVSGVWDNLYLYFLRF